MFKSLNKKTNILIKITMANNEIVKILRVETQGSERTVKGLKDEIKALKDALLNVEQGSQQYDDIVKQLKSDQEDLTRVMNAGKQDFEALEGSYNHLVKTMGELKKEWRATTDEVRRNELGTQIDDINTQLKNMDASIGNFQRNVGNYTESFAEAMKKQQEATEQTRAKLESISKIATGLANGYAAVQGAMAIIGVENKKLEETFVKLQAAIALAQGVGGLKDLVEGFSTAQIAFKGAIMGVKSFITSLRGIKAAIAGTGLGLLVVAIGLVVEHLITMEEEASEAQKELDNLTNSLDSLKRAIAVNELNNATTALTQYKQAVIDANGNVEKLKQAQEQYNEELKKTRKRELEASKALWEEKKAQAEAIKKENEFGDSEKWKQAEENRKKAEQEINAIEKELLKLAETEQNTIVDAAVKAQEEATTKAKERKEQIEEIQKKLQQSLLSQREIELNELAEQYEKEKQLLQGRNNDLLLLEEIYYQKKKEINNKYAEEERQRQEESLLNEYNNTMGEIDANQDFAEETTSLKFDGMETNNPVEAIQLEIDKLNELRTIRLEYHNERLTQIEELLNSEIISTEQRLSLEAEKAQMTKQTALEEQRFINENSRLQKQRINEEKKLKKMQVNATVDTTRDMLSAVSTLMKDGSKEQKGVATAIATIDALKSANAAYSAMAGIPIVGPALGVAAAASALVAGYANVKAIWATNEDGSNSNATLGASSTASVTPTINANEAIPVEYTRNIMTNAEVEELNKPQRVYVLESDIRETQNKVEVIENNATF